ncbi:MAG TPA: bifunctional DNA-formamidopyrimidine glycosylase/DNA-(apurinic or apyrimidinic site) lyase [bacterium]|nr:bifunctional DNA-formamidopyrimidine glycosylase/DNA-(apurinic or apyrimidinic site) lyase [bacterium]
MPELPEVETIRRSLLFLEGRNVASLSFSRLAPVETTRPEILAKNFQGQRIHKLERRGKYLLICNEDGAAMVLHLGMSGRLQFFATAPARLGKHDHMVFEFDDGSRLIYQDARRFGTLSLSLRAERDDNAFLQRLGPDFLEENWIAEDFVGRCRRHPGIDLKALTLHQGIAAGLGNIYACEALYRAGLSPRRRIRRTKDSELAALWEAARATLRLGIEMGGSSLRDYFDGLGNRGVMKEYLQVYDREGLCTLDGRGMVRRIVQQGRSTWYSPEIQR